MTKNQSNDELRRRCLIIDEVQSWNRFLFFYPKSSFVILHTVFEQWKLFQRVKTDNLNVCSGSLK